MKRHIRRGLVLASLAVSLAAPAVAQADVLNDWNVIAQNQAIAIRPTAHGQTLAASRWCRGRCTTPSTRSSHPPAVPARPRDVDVSRSARRMPPSRPPRTTCS